ncbi:MAG: DUF5689 domain-containing protein [Rikenellaceae bacterium]
MKKIAYISLLLLTASACSRSETDDNAWSIASLRNIETNSRSVLITQNITLEGTITANDKYGEFYNSLIAEDQSGAVKIMCEVENSYQLYPFGTHVSISCSGLYLNNQYGAISLGTEPTSDYTLDYISQSKVGQYIKTLDNESSAPQPLITTIGSLTPLHTYMYVELSDIMINNEDNIATFCQRDSSTGRTVDTYHTITDSLGNTAELAVDRLCSYADATLPATPCTIQAIVTYYYDSQYTLTITNCAYSTEQ